MEDLITWFVAEGHGYPLLFAALLASGLGLPIPEDVPLMAAGVMAAGGGMGVLPASLACGVFVLMRDGFVFWLGYKYGVELLDKPWARRIVRRELVEKFRDRVQKNEKAVVFSGRFMPGLRGPVFFAAGTARVSPISFVVVDTFAALISVPIWVWLGFMFADNYDQLTAAARHFRVGLLGTAAVVLLVVLFRILRKRRAAGQPRP
jgi:membrane protein DedA with SNARE-associated domain